MKRLILLFVILFFFNTDNCYCEENEYMDYYVSAWIPQQEMLYEEGEEGFYICNLPHEDFDPIYSMGYIYPYTYNGIWNSYTYDRYFDFYRYQYIPEPCTIGFFIFGSLFFMKGKK